MPVQMHAKPDMKSVHITRCHYKEDLERDNDDEGVFLSCDMQKNNYVATYIIHLASKRVFLHANWLHFMKLCSLRWE